MTECLMNVCCFIGFLHRQALIMAVDWAGYGYAALVTSGGVMGYVKAGL